MFHPRHVRECLLEVIQLHLAIDRVHGVDRHVYAVGLDEPRVRHEIDVALRTDVLLVVRRHHPTEVARRLALRQTGRRPINTTVKAQLLEAVLQVDRVIPIRLRHTGGVQVAEQDTRARLKVVSGAVGRVGEFEAVIRRQGRQQLTLLPSTRQHDTELAENVKLLIEARRQVRHLGGRTRGR